MTSLGAGALKASRGPNAISREEVSMANYKWQKQITPVFQETLQLYLHS